MREILFRGKDADNGEWVYGYYAHFKNMHDVKADIIYTGYADMYMGSILPECYDVNPKTIGQYTGLKDVHNTRVFEGDIVKVYDVYCNETVVGVVEFCDGSFRIYDKDFTSYDRWMYCKVEVIGNVHDDVNLLEA